MRHRSKNAAYAKEKNEPAHLMCVGMKERFEIDKTKDRKNEKNHICQNGHGLKNSLAKQNYVWVIEIQWVVFV